MSQNNDRDDDNYNESGEGFACCGCCNDIALKINEYIEKAFCAVGYIVGQWPYIVLGLVLLFLGLCCFGFLFVSIETNIFDLWTPTNSPVFEEGEFIDFYWGDKDFGLLVISAYSKDGEDTNILNEEYLTQWYQIHLDLATRMPTKDYTYVGEDNSEQTVTFSYFAGMLIYIYIFVTCCDYAVNIINRKL